MRTANLSGMDNYSLSDGVDKFRNELEAYGLRPNRIIADGEVHRCQKGDGKKNDDGWYVLNSGATLYGAYGTWSPSFESIKWTEKRRSEMNYEERKALREQMRLTKEKTDADRKIKLEKCVSKVKSIFSIIKDADFLNPYVEAKEIKPYGAKVTEDGRLMVIMRDVDKNVTGAQYIKLGEKKRFEPGTRLAGSFILLAAKKGFKPEGVLICEGWATACSLFEAMDERYNVVATLSAYNTMSVAKIVRAKFPAEMKFIVCAEDDWKKEINVGMDKAREAALEIGAAFAAPHFGDSRGEKDTDFNDMARVMGHQEVARIIREAKPLHEEKDHEHEPQRSPEVFSDSDSDRAPGIEIEPGIQGGAGDEEADRGDYASPGNAEEDQGHEFESIPLSAYEHEGAKEAHWIEPFEGAMETLFRIGYVKQHRPQPALTVAAALAAMSACLHGKYCLPDGLRGNLYVIGLAGSGSGKGEPLELVSAVVSVAGGIPYSQVGSGQGIERVMKDSDDKRAALVIDEVGHLIGAYSDKKAAHYLASIGDMFLKMYSNSKSQYTTRMLANQDESSKQLFNPHLTLYGTTTFHKMQGINPDLIKEGMMGRCLIVNGEDFVEQIDNMGDADYWGDIDRELGLHIRNIYHFGDKLMRPNGERWIVPISDDAAEMLSDLRIRLNEESKHAESSKRDLIQRALEQVKRICLVLAVWDREMKEGSTMVYPAHVQWAENFVRHSQKCLLGFVDTMGSNPTVALAQKVKDTMRDAIDGKRPFKGVKDARANAVAEVEKVVFKTAISRKLGVDKKELDPAIALLIEREEIAAEQVLNPDTNRRTMAYRFI